MPLIGHNFHLYSSFVRGDIIFVRLRHMYLKELMIPKNLRKLHNFVGASITLIASTLDDRDITSLLLTQKPRYSVSIHSKNDFSEFTFWHNTW